MTIDKNFDPAAIEAKWYAHWESTGAFRPDRPDAEPYTIVNPPPNVTGSLHIGHALDNTLQDILIRHARLQGKDALWVVGTDHAGIATQMVVERQMALTQQKRTDFTRDEFIAKVWEWKEESGGEITQQLRRLGCSMDWANERFTMDEGFSKAVIKVFVDLYNQGLLYRDKRLVNWDPGLKTAISDLEVETREVGGKFWHFKYPLEDGSGHISVATTRPETMLADMAVAVNPTDERYAHLVGKNVRLPITGRLIPIVTDDHADPELGSGAVKITPGHDFNDFEVGKRAGFKAGGMLNMLDAEAKVVQTADGLIPENLLGKTVQQARDVVVALIDAEGLLEKIEDRIIQTPFGDRSGVVIEPWLTDQWYVDAKTLAGPAIEAVRSGAIDIVPKSWEKTFFNWMENIQPWCVSRQLWWGHRIPAWFGPELDEVGKPILHKTSMLLSGQPHRTFVATSWAEAQLQAREAYGDGYQIIAGSHEDRGPDYQPLGDEEGSHIIPLWRDEDVLDTWFSSALWPFGTLGWPEDDAQNTVRPEPVEGQIAQGGGASTGSARTDLAVTPGSLLNRHYPNDVLVSGFDILFFWDARMAMQGLHFMKEVPWKTLYLHGLVRAADGSKMSKSKGNTVDPLGLIDQYGADALRFFMAAMESQGRDIKMDESRVAGYRNFATKLWNAARFAQSNGIGGSHSISAPKAELAVNRWIIGEVVETVEKLNKAFAEFRFDGMADAIYHFVWDQFCDWYLELIKPVLDTNRESNISQSALEARATETRIVAGWVFDQILVMLHPFMPFITEELWHEMSKRKYDLIHARWPEPKSSIDVEARRAIHWVIELIAAVRTARAEANIAPAEKLNWTITQLSDWTMEAYFNNQQAIRRIARIDKTEILDTVQTFEGEDGSITGTSGIFSEIREDQFARAGKIQIVAPDFLAFAIGSAPVDIDAERTRITKAIEAATKERDSLAGRLNNPAFVEKAKPEAVEKARADHAEKAEEAERLLAALARLG